MKTRFLFILLFFNLLFFSQLFPLEKGGIEKSDSTGVVLSENQFAVGLYNRGMEFLKADSIDAAIKAFKRAIRIDKKFIEAHHQLGMTYVEKGTIYHRMKAVRALREALFWDRKNFQIQLDLGKVYLLQNFRYNAKKKFNWLRKTNPNNIELLLALAKLYQDDVEYYQNMVNTFMDDRGALTFVDASLLSNIFDYTGPADVKRFIRDRDELFGQFQDYTSYLQKDFAEAAKAYIQVLNLDPENREALYQLSLLAFTAGMISDFIKFQERLLELDPDDKDAHLFLGLGYHKLKNYDLAYNEFEIARSLMEPNELAVFNSIEHIVPHNERKGYVQFASYEKAEFEKEYWKGKDPFFLSPYNERIMEHYCRVAYSNLKFRVPRKDKPGWDTDRGMIYIRYGQPLRIARLKPSHGGFGGLDFELTEIWYYENFSFAFADTYLTGDFRLGSRSRFPGVNFPEIAYVQYRETPEIYNHNYEGIFFEVPYYTSSFRRENQKSQTEVYYAIPKNSLKYTRDDSTDTASVLQGFFAFDEDWNEVYRSVTKEKFILNRYLNPKKDFHIICQNNLDIPPGEYNFVLEFQDEGSRNSSAQRTALKVDSYEFGKLNISDIALASSIDTTFNKTVFSTHDLEIIPNPTRTFKKENPLYVYFEIYNLALRAPGETSFDVAYDVSTYDEEKSTDSNIFSRIGDIFRTKGDRMAISSSYFYTGNSPTEKINLSIDVSALKNDIYNLAIRVFDINGDESIVKDIKMKIQDDVIYYLY